MNWLDTSRVARARQGFEVGGDCIAILRRSRNAGRSSAEANSAFYEIQQAKLQRTQTLDVPTLFIAGSLDGCTLPDSSRNVEEFYRADYQRIDLPTTGHFPHCEQPGTVGDLIAGVMEW